MAGCISKTTRGTRTVKDDTQYQEAEVEKEEQLPVPKVYYTFLDTINQGNELVLTNEDFDKNNKNTVQSSLSASVEEENNTQFRVQVFASNKIDAVREQKKRLEHQINEVVVIGYEAPYYKLYAGIFSKRTEAYKTLFKVKKLGYTDAWIVATKTVLEN